MWYIPRLTFTKGLSTAKYSVWVLGQVWLRAVSVIGDAVHTRGRGMGRGRPGRAGLDADK